jgi:sorting nexin-29
MCLNETYCKVLISKHLSDNFPIQNGLKQGEALWPLVFSFAFEYAIRKVQKNQVKVKVYGTHQLLVYADDLNSLGDNITKHTGALPDASKEVDIQVNTENRKYMLMSHHQNGGKNHIAKIASRSFENVARFKHLGMTVTNQNFIQEQIKKRLNSSNACYHSVQNLMSSRMLSKNVKIRMYRTTIFPVVLYGCET